MSDRTTKVTLTAVVEGYIAGLQRAQRATKKFTDDSVKQAQAQGDALNKVGKVAGVAMLAAGAAAAAGVALAVKKFAEFDSEMAQVASLAHATASEMDALTNAALNAGQKFGYSATQVAEAETELVKAGISVNDILGGALTGALTLAADGQMNVADATQIAAEAMTQFGLKGKDVPHIADLLAAGADKALGSVGDLGQALESGGLVANQFGLSIEETVGTLSAFAQAGLIGETAGTDLRQMLLKLGNPSVQAAKTMKDLGISLYDAKGNFVGMADLAGQLQVKMSKLDPATRNAALATIFGSRAIAGANVLYSDGKKGISDWTSAVDDSGFAARQAQGKLNSLQGDVQKLSAAFDTDLIKSGSAANGMLRGMVQTGTDALHFFSSLPQPVQSAALAIGGVTGAVGLLGGTLLLGLPKIVEFQGALMTLESSGIRGVSAAAGGLRTTIGGVASFMTGPWGIALGVGAAALGGLWLQNLQESQQRVNDFSDSLDKNTGKLTDNTRAVAFKQLSDSGSLKRGETLGVDAKTLTDAALGDQSAQKLIQQGQQKAGDAWRASKGGDIGSPGDRDLLARMQLWDKLSNAIGITNASLKGAIDASQQWLVANGATKTAQDDVTKSLGQFNDAVVTNGHSTDKTSAAYRANKSALDDLGSKANDYIATTKNQYKSTQLTAQAQTSMAQTLVHSAEQMGMSQAAAIAYTAKLLGIPASRVTETAVTGVGSAAKNATAVKDAINAIPSNRNTKVTVNAYGAFSTLDELNAYLNQLGNKEVKVGGSAAGFYGFKQARGSVLDFYAQGGLREDHVAQIAPAGSWRVWAEPETGGEAYIPLAPAKRERSLSIWQATGRRLGVQGFADGGITYAQAPPSYSSAAPTVTVSPMVSLKGATLLMSVDGRQMTAVIQDQIVRSRAADTNAARRGSRGIL